MVVLGVIIFAGASALCGATPRGSAAEAWLITFRAVQGAGGAIMFPAAIAIVVQTFELRSRGRALALFFGVAGGLTAIGPIAGGYLFLGRRYPIKSIGCLRWRLTLSAAAWP